MAIKFNQKKTLDFRSAIIAAGGSGGHIYPGLALADALKDIDSELKIFFWGNKKGMEARLIPPMGYELLTTSLGRLNSNVPFLERVWTLFQLPFAILKAVIIILFKKPAFVIGMGGHASAPIVLAAKICGVKNFLWEPNAYPGLANRKLSQFVDESFVVFDESKKFLKSPKISTAGFLIRKELENFSRVKKLTDNSVNVLVFGGSQGSQFINHVVSKMILNHQSALSKYQFLHQTGFSEFEEISKKYRGIANVKPYAYFEDMPERMKWADLVVCRAGTSTISELAAVGLTGLFIPLSNSSDNHQKKNAEVISKKNAGLMLLEKDLNAKKLFCELIKFVEDREKFYLNSQNIRSLHTPKGAEKLAKEIYSQTFFGKLSL